MPPQGPNAGPFARASAGSASQAVLAPIAPRPSPPMLQNGVVVTPPAIGQGMPSDQYGLFGYTFDGQTFADSDLPPRMRQDPAQQENVYEKRQSVPGTNLGPQPAPGPLQRPKQQHGGMGDSDSGIDMGFPGFPSEWSHSSISSADPPVAATLPDQPITGMNSTTDARGYTCLWVRFLRLFFHHKPINSILEVGSIRIPIAIGTIPGSPRGSQIASINTALKHKECRQIISVILLPMAFRERRKRPLVREGGM